MLVIHRDRKPRAALLRYATAAVLAALICVALTLLPDVQRTLEAPSYRLSPLRYDLAKLRGKGLVHRVTGTQRYEVTSEGYRLAVLYQKLYHRLYGPLTASTLEPVAADNRVPGARKAKLDRLYEAVDKALRQLSAGVGIAA